MVDGSKRQFRLPFPLSPERISSRKGTIICLGNAPIRRFATPSWGISFFGLPYLGCFLINGNVSIEIPKCVRCRIEDRPL